MILLRRATQITLAVTAASSSMVSAYSVRSTSTFFGRRLSLSMHHNHRPARRSTTSRHAVPHSVAAHPTLHHGRSRATPTMLFGKLFGGGAFDLKIDYSSLPFPGNELGAAAIEGTILTTSPQEPELHIATFAGGCFWGLELAFQRVPGVAYTAVGYCQGPESYPNYDQVCAGATGHTEAVSIYYNPQQVSYQDLLDTFFGHVDPTTIGGQGRDFGRQYRMGVYVHTPEQEAVARARFEEEQRRYSQPIATELEAVKPFWPAEAYHQQYLEKGGRFGQPQDASKGATETIRCYG